MDPKKSSPLTDEYGLICDPEIVEILKVFHGGCVQTMEELLKVHDFTPTELVIIKNALETSVLAVITSQINQKRKNIQKNKQPRKKIITPGSKLFRPGN